MKTMLCLVCSFGLLAALFGCENKPVAHDDFMSYDAHQVWRFIDNQAASGAAADGMFYPMHFDGGKLNSLGREKLEMIVHDSEAPHTVYLNLIPDDSQTAARHASLEQAMQEMGVAADAFAIKDGMNEASSHSAASELTRMWKTELPNDKTGVSGTSDGRTESMTATGMK